MACWTVFLLEGFNQWDSRPDAYRNGFVQYGD
jgi:hypothetical protein